MNRQFKKGEICICVASMHKIFFQFYRKYMFQMYTRTSMLYWYCLSIKITQQIFILNDNTQHFLSHTLLVATVNGHSLYRVVWQYIKKIFKKSTHTLS